VFLFPAATIWWLVGALVWWRRPPRTEAELRRHVAWALAAAWISLTLLLPAVFGWVWADRAHIRAWIATWNENPRPFVRTKTADQILESIARYCNRINESRH
jgi:hypothetical protein